MADQSSEGEPSPSQGTGIRAVDELSTDPDEGTLLEKEPETGVPPSLTNGESSDESEGTSIEKPLGEVLEPNEPSQSHPNDTVWWKILGAGTPLSILCVVSWPLFATGVLELTAAGTIERLVLGSAAVFMLSLAVLSHLVILPAALMQDISIIRKSSTVGWTPPRKWYLLLTVLTGGLTTAWYLGERSVQLDRPKRWYSSVARLQETIQQSQKRTLALMGGFDLSSAVLVAAFGVIPLSNSQWFVPIAYVILVLLGLIVACRWAFLARVFLQTTREQPRSSRVRGGAGVICPLVLAVYEHSLE